MNLIENVNIERAIVGQSSAAASTGKALDMQGYEGCMFVLAGSSLMEASTNVTLKAAGAASTTATFITYNATGAASTMTTGTFDNKILAVDYYKPLKRYIQAEVTGSSSDVGRAFQVIAIRYGARKPGSTGIASIGSTYVGDTQLQVGATS